MAEALLRIVDQVNADPYVDVKLTKAGHVIMVVEDGYTWSPLERTNDFWRIIAIPGLAVDTLQDFLDGEGAARFRVNALDPLADPRTNRMLQIRAWSIDIASLPANVRAVLLAPRTGNGVLTVSPAHVAAAKKRLAARPDPGLIG